MTYEHVYNACNIFKCWHFLLLLVGSLNSAYLRQQNTIAYPKCRIWVCLGSAMSLIGFSAFGVLYAWWSVEQTWPFCYRLYVRPLYIPNTHLVIFFSSDLRMCFWNRDLLSNPALNLLLVSLRFVWGSSRQ